MGLALGLGFLSKYAMSFFLLGLSIYFIFVPASRTLLKNSKFWTAIAISLLILLPNIIWNLENGLVTFSHTADNANWKGTLLHPNKALEFFLAQFGVFGPILFGALLTIIGRLFIKKYRQDKNYKLEDKDKLLLSLSIPIILIITIQAFLSRAHANWAATAYPAATILVIALMFRHQAIIAMRSSFALHALIILVIAFGTATAGQYGISKNITPFSRVLGWKELSKKAEEKLSETQYTGILTNSRDVSAELVYYLRNKQKPIWAWKKGVVPRDYYQMKQPFPKKQPPNGNILFVSKRRNAPNLLKHFKDVEYLGQENAKAGKFKKRRLYFYSLGEYIKAENNDR